MFLFVTTAAGFFPPQGYKDLAMAPCPFVVLLLLAVARRVVLVY